MSADFSRSRRIGELIQRELATMLTREVKDPRLGLVSITAVDVTRDLGLAKVFYTLINSDHDTEEVQLSLKKAAGFFRYELGRRIKLRIIPRLEFRYDDSVIHGAQLSRLIDDVIEDDKKRHNTSNKITSNSTDSEKK